MADVAGSLLTFPSPGASVPDKRRYAYQPPAPLPSSANPDKRRLSELFTLGDGGGGPVPPATVTHYKLRVRDDGAGPPGVYREWESTDYTSSPPPPAPLGSWVERTILATWTT